MDPAERGFVRAWIWVCPRQSAWCILQSMPVRSSQVAVLLVGLIAAMPAQADERSVHAQKGDAERGRRAGGLGHGSACL